MTDQTHTAVAFRDWLAGPLTEADRLRIELDELRHQAERDAYLRDVLTLAHADPAVRRAACAVVDEVADRLLRRGT